eukprot:scaffold32301_cov135-Isochrysis_galbana.AAC.18
MARTRGQANSGPKALSVRRTAGPMPSRLALSAGMPGDFPQSSRVLAVPYLQCSSIGNNLAEYDGNEEREAHEGLRIPSSGDGDATHPSRSPPGTPCHAHRLDPRGRASTSSAKLGRYFPWPKNTPLSL